MVKRLKRMLCALLALLTLMACQPAMAASYSAYINTSTRVYSQPTSSSRRANVSAGTKVEVTGVKNGWARIVRNGVTGYCYVQFITLTDRLKGYINKDTKLYESASRYADSDSLAVNTTVYVIGMEDDFYHVEDKYGTWSGYIYKNCISKKRVSVSATPAPTAKPEEAPATNPKDMVELLDWFEGGSSVLTKGQYGVIYDIRTGISIRVKRMGGTNHADLEPVTASDAAKLKRIAGGEYSWESHPAILIANGRYVACAINTMPHGRETIYNNDYEGQFCLHMINSRTHESDTVNASHQDAIAQAWYWANH